MQTPDRPPWRLLFLVGIWDPYLPPIRPINSSWRTPTNPVYQVYLVWALSPDSSLSATMGLINSGLGVPFNSFRDCPPWADKLGSGCPV